MDPAYNIPQTLTWKEEKNLKVFLSLEAYIDEITQKYYRKTCYIYADFPKMISNIYLRRTVTDKWFEKFSLNFSILLFVIRVNLLHP